MDKFYSMVEERSEEWIEKLKEAVAIDSVSAEPARRPKCEEMMVWAKAELERLGAQTELHDIGMQKLADGSEIPLPSILTATMGDDKEKCTLCIYGHLDVQPAEKEDGWSTDPFVLTEVDGKLFGRGSTDDKGPVLAWIHAIDSFQKLGYELPVNLKFVLEGMEESGSLGLDDWIFAHPEFFADVDFTCISDNYWLGTTKPCITYGLRGMSYFEVTVSCAQKDLHSGVYGGPVREAMTDLVKLMASLQNEDGSPAIEGFMDNVAPFTEEEKKILDDVEFDPEEFKAEIGTSKLRFEDKRDILAARWRFPTVSLHGIEGAWSGPGAKTVVCQTVKGKFSCRLVPHQTPEEIEALVKTHLEKEFAKYGSPNKLEVRMIHGGKPWLADHNDENYTAARNAVKDVFKVEPDLTREGGSIPVTNTFAEITGKSVLLLPIGSSDDSAHSTNEKLNRSNYINGIKLLGAYIFNLPKEKKNFLGCKSCV